MKKSHWSRFQRRCVICFIGLGWLTLSGPVGASPEQPRAKTNGVVTTSVITPLFGAYYLESHIRIANRLGLVLNTSRLILSDDEWTTTANTAGAGLSYYFRDDAVRGWYVEAIGELWLNSREHDPSGRAARVFGGGVLAEVGYRFVHALGPVLDLALGAVAVRVPGADVQTATGAASTGAQTLVLPTVKVNVGWAF